MKKLILITFMVATFLGGGLAPPPSQAYAQEGGAADEVMGAQGSCPRQSEFLGIPTWYKYIGSTEVIGGRCSPKVTFPNDILKILMAVFEMILRVAGLVAIGFVIYGGIQYVVSQGDPEKVKSARNSIIHALIGLAIAVSATAMVNLVARGIT